MNDSSAVAAKFSNSRDSTGINHEKVPKPLHDYVEESSGVCKRKRKEFFGKLGETELAQRTLNPFHDTAEEIQNNNINTEQNTTMNDPAPFDEQDGNIKDQDDDNSDDKEEENDDDDENDKEDDEKAIDPTLFFSAPAFTAKEMAKVEPRIREMIAGPFQSLEANGYETFMKYLREREQKRDRHSKAQLQKMQQALQDATIRGDPREYQTALFEIAKTKNTIVNLGTGFGKTLIALLCIRHFSPDFDQGKQTLFLVPSVALAIQQSATLRANLPNFSVQTACYASSNSDASRRALGKANVIVATHGAIHDLLMHYADIFQMSRFNLLVIDECHYATGNHAYAVVMKKFYHSTPKEQRPRVLGLTASPLVNVKETHSDEQLASMLSSLESILDSTLASISDLVSEDGMSGLLRKTAEERVVQFTGTNVGNHIPTADNLPLHESRFREFRQLNQLYQDLGPLVLSTYCETLARELSINTFEKESATEFNRAVKHLRDLATYCEQECDSAPNEGRTDKLLALEELLEKEIEEHGGAETVGLVFVERRITAMALHNYFLYRNDKLEEGKWTRAIKARYQTHTLPVQLNIDAGTQFDDAEDDPFTVFQADHPSLNEVKTMKDAPTPRSAPTADRKQTPSNDQFLDADGDEEIEGFETLPITKSVLEINNDTRRNTIRSAVLVRNATQIFKSLCMARNASAEKEDKLKSTWLHQDTKVRDVLNLLRRKETNILIATSVVEEGIDVRACSFVAVFDALKNTKSYIQMKGRARQKNAKFFVFHDKTSNVKTILSLSLAQDMERRVHKFIEGQTRDIAPPPRSRQKVDHQEEDTETPSELAALEAGSYAVPNGTVDLHSAKSLLNRYTLSVPLDPFVRSSKESLLAHMPTYESDQLILPAHLPRKVRMVTLPGKYQDLPKKDKHKMLALMACVRLHSLHLLSDRLLPLTRKDMQEQILRVATRKVKTVPWLSPSVDKAFSEGTIQIHVYPIRQTSPSLTRYHSILHGKGHSLALTTFEPAGIKTPEFKLKHAEFGVVSNSLGEASIISCSSEQRSILSRIFVLLLNERWRRRTRNMHFRRLEKEEYSGVVAPYLIGIVSSSGQLDWDFMKNLLSESSRSQEERTGAACSASSSEKLPEPRLWSPLYDEHVTYIAYGPSGETCEAPFPHEKEGVNTYHDYFVKHRGHDVPKNSLLFDVQRLWALPSNFPVLEKHEESEPHNNLVVKTAESRYITCTELASVKLAQGACFEPLVANAHVALLCSLLPQFLFFFERFLVTKAFINHCVQYIPTLGECVASLPVEKVANALTAKSCTLEDSYDKLEWFGDAVLKLVQTDSLMKSIELRQWIAFLHEGDLSTLRSAMGSNDRLEKTCKHLRLDNFIMTAALARGQWMPAGITFSDGTKLTHDEPLGGKVYADIIESILGLVYLEFNYETALMVADELQVTLPWDNDTEQKTDHIMDNTHLLEAVRRCTGYDNFKQPELVEEAFTHPSALHPTVPSYQRLEWAGDAALCLAVREWIFKNLGDISLGDMVVMEAALVANETLAYLSIRNGLQHHLNHRDQTLPSRIEAYDWSVRELGRGLWGTDPPKSIADTVEAVIGAVHVDGGYAEGQKAVLQLLAPILDVIFQARTEKKEIYVKHPKKIMQEMGGELLELSSASEADFAASKEEVPVWFGTKWGTADRDGTSYIASIEVLGSTILAVSDPSVAVARNRACALITATLERDYKLLNRLQACRVKVESNISRAAKGPAQGSDEKDENEDLFP